MSALPRFVLQALAVALGGVIAGLPLAALGIGP